MRKDEDLPVSANWSDVHGMREADTYKRRGDWLDQTLADYLEKAMEADSERQLFWERSRRWRVREIHEGAHALAAYLRELGVRRGDVISFQLPNWTEAVAAADDEVLLAPRKPRMLCPAILLSGRHR